MLPGEGLNVEIRSSRPWRGRHRPASGREKRCASSSVAQRLMSSCSTPWSSGNSREHGGAAELDEQVGDVADGRIGGDAAEAVGAAALEADGERGEGRRRTFGAIGLDESGKGLVESAGHQHGFASGALLIDEEDRFGQLGIAGAHLVHRACWTARSGSRG